METIFTPAAAPALHSAVTFDWMSCKQTFEHGVSSTVTLNGGLYADLASASSAGSLTVSSTTKCEFTWMMFSPGVAGATITPP